MSSLIRERYEVVAVVGRGGQGTVMRALDIVHQRDVAIKVRALDSEEERAVLLEEAGVLFSVRPHHNLPLLREDFVDGNHYYLVMDWIEGRDLGQVLKEEGAPGLPAERVLDYITQAAEALDHLHDHDPPVVHQDVKPANLILTADGQVVLVDFGISRYRYRDGSGPERRGTPDYVAPEVAREGPTPASDVFGLAVTTYVLLTGAPPRPEVRPQLRSLPGGGTAVIRALRRGLATNPANRQASARAFVEAVRVGMEGEVRPVRLPDRQREAEVPPSAPRGGVGQPKMAFGAARVSTVALAVGLAALLVTALVMSLWKRSPDQAVPPPVEPLKLIDEGPESCPRGYLCVWKDRDYQGSGVAIYGTEANWEEFPPAYRFIANAASSTYNNGHPERLPDVTLYELPSHQGKSLVVANGAQLPTLGEMDDRAISNKWF